MPNVFVARWTTGDKPPVSEFNSAGWQKSHRFFRFTVFVAPNRRVTMSMAPSRKLKCFWIEKKTKTQYNQAVMML